MSKKNKDPYPIVDVYHVTNSLIDAATVVVTDLCENLSNAIKTYDSGILDSLKKINTKKYNSISVGNGADGIYPVWAGVDKNNKVRKIFASVNSSVWDWDSEKVRKLVSWSWYKSDLNDQFFSTSNKKAKRKKLFDLEIKSGAIAIGDYGGNFQFEHHDHIVESLDDKYFKINDIYQNNYPIGLFIFKYGHNHLPENSSKNSKTNNKKIVNINDFKKYKYVEFLSTLLDESCYPTKYIFEQYLVEQKDSKDKINLKISDEKISANYLADRLPKALEILKKQNQILFGRNFKQVHEIRKAQLENFIHGIIRDIEPQKLNLPTFGKKISKQTTEVGKLTVETPGLPYIQETFYDGYKLKSEPSLLESSTIPVKNGKYPCYVHVFEQKDEENDYELENVYIVIEGLENCYLNRNSKGQLFFDKKFRESLFLKEQIKKKSKKISIDKICLRNSDTLDELKKINFVEELELHGFNSIKDWSGLSKLKQLKKIKLISCNVDRETSDNFFKNLYSLNNLEELIIDDTSRIEKSAKLKLPKNLFFKKLKSYQIDIRKDWKKSEHENSPGHKGYGNKNVWFISYDLPNIYEFPNFEKFKSLEKLYLYNFFSEYEKEGSLFDYDLGIEGDLVKINTLCKKSKIKDIWIYGYHFQKANELAGTKFLDLALKLIKDSNVKINGINKDTLQKIHKIPISSYSQIIKKLILVNKIDKINHEKIISQENSSLSLNYFSALKDTENKNLLNDAFNQPLEEIEIDNTFQFVRSEINYRDTFSPIEKHLENNKNIKKIIFKLDESELSEEYKDFSGSWDYYESKSLNDFISKLLINYPHLKIIIQHDTFKKALKDTKKLSFYLEIFEMYKLLDEDSKTKNRFEIIGFNTNEITKILDKYYLDVADTIVVIEDNVGWNASKAVRDIELFDKYRNFESDQFPISLGLKKIKVSSEGEKPYVKEGQFINRMFEFENFYSYSTRSYYHFLNNKIEGSHPEKPIIFVKQKYLDRIKKTLFKNIKHYFYFGVVDYSFDKFDNIKYNKFWKEKEYFKFPNSIKFNKLETLNISGGRNVKLNSLFKQIDCTNLKQLILSDCVIEERTFPSLPKIEKLIIEDQYSKNAKPFANFSNISKLKHLEFRGLYNVDNITSRWMTTDFDFRDIQKLSNLKYLKMLSLQPEYLPFLGKLKNLEELDLSFKLITAEMHSDDGTINENLVDKDFEFLKNFEQLKKLKLVFPIKESSIKGPSLLSFVNKKLEELSLDFAFKDENIKHGYETIKYITKYFKNLKLLKLRMGRNEINDFEVKRKKNTYIVYFKKTGEKWKEGTVGPRPFILDLNQFTSLKKLEGIEFDNPLYDAMGFKVINPVKITKLKNLKNIHINVKKFASEDLIKIRNITEVPRDKFFEECKKKNKSIINEYDLSEKDQNKYDLLDRQIIFGGSIETKWGGKSIETILKERKGNKKNDN